MNANARPLPPSNTPYLWVSMGRRISDCAIVYKLLDTFLFPSLPLMRRKSCGVCDIVIVPTEHQISGVGVVSVMSKTNNANIVMDMYK